MKGRYRAENALLIAAAQCGAAAEYGAAPHYDWDYLYRAAERQGLLPLVHEWFRAQASLGCPPALAERLRGAYWSNHFRNEVLLRELAAILRAAANHDVPVMPLKGAALILDYYADAALRPMSDLDLLIPPAAAATFAHLLVTEGYREIPAWPSTIDERYADPRHRERAFVAERAGIPVMIEFRSEPLDPGLWQMAELDAKLSTRLLRNAERMFARGQVATFRGAPYWRGAPEDLLFHVASHMATRHADFRLIWLHDLGQIILGGRPLDWSAVLTTARSLRLSIPVFAALQGAERWVGAPVPQAILRAGLPGERGGPRALLDRREYRFLTARLAALDREDLAAAPPSDTGRKVVSVLRVRGVRPWLRAARWALVPGHDYIAGWRGQAGAVTGRAYVAAVLLRLLLGALRAVQLLGTRLALPWLPQAAQRLSRWLRRTACVQPFPEFADRFSALTPPHDEESGR